ncbi:MAG: glutathione S-transferase family protein [Nostoc sp. ChiSLP02]|nr:glutathione S-transferase family protein [Nostoc sp. DedSLP05]MDZ8103422.1 glutathione S-transferase family protein [Nostoc sp. DedSLP01]MDZ8185599.1 glutathione S-transferase family protein [Nostoc sp. ChiSLP02]
MAEIKLYSAVVCPYAHRTRLVLQEKGIDFDLIEIDLDNPPEGFRNISPYGKVPALVHNNERVWESAIINEYLDEVFPNPPLLPSNLIAKAQARIWIDFANTRFVSAFYDLLRSSDVQKQEQAKQEIYKHLEFIENEGLGKLSGEGPYWFGKSVSLVDFTFFPWFERWGALKHYRSFALPTEFRRLRQWEQALKERDSVKAIASPDEFYIERYTKFVAPTPVGV